LRFTAPDADERRRAIGSTDECSEALRKALEAGTDFRPIPEPGPHDWLAVHEESGQTFEQFVRSRLNVPDDLRRRIYLQPLGEFPAGKSPPLERLLQFAEAFFAMDVAILPLAELAAGEITTRTNSYTGQPQLLTGDILAFLRRRVPDDAYCVLGITVSDLYPDPAWNFVFGQASLRDRIGVYSFARYDPGFYGEQVEDAEKLLLRRSCKVLAHETAHMFGIEHCIFFHCLMNGSNHLEESDARPLHLCPVDLRKLHFSVGFDVLDRYRRLHDFCAAVGFEDEARWLAKRLEQIEGTRGGRTS
jgi:archaemetzincin